ncbi:hypothetical protein DFS34DRAFT_383413 [Phlyctochytrium arcticum]|nr:hypothetical protein DFS34DRAFT_383413 [Phlyctochytrium arcticum]
MRIWDQSHSVRHWRCGTLPSSKPASIDSEPGAKVYKNEKIPHLFVSVVAEDGSDLGLKSVTEALKLFDRRTHDLVLLSKTNGPPSCRIMSHEAQKQAKADAKGPKKAKSGKSAKNNITKELEIGTAISQHDLDIKMAKATQFLEEGCKVQLTITKKPVGSVDAVLKQVETILKPVSLPPQPAPPQGRKQIVLFLPKASRK